MGRRIRVLIADDPPLVRRALCMMLKSAPDVEIAALAANGDEAVKLAAAVRPDVIVMDYRMPKMDDAEATRWIRARIGTPRSWGCHRSHMTRATRCVPLVLSLAWTSARISMMLWRRSISPRNCLTSDRTMRWRYSGRSGHSVAHYAIRPLS